MLQAMSDKALIYECQNGNIQALDVLAGRFRVPIADKSAVISALKRLRVVSVNAARRILFANAGRPE